MHIRCQHCSCVFEAPYWQLGLPQRCPHCGRETLLTRDCVVNYHSSGWSVTFLDFVQLVTDATYRDTILPLVRSFGYEPVAGSPSLVRNANGETLTAADVHARIQMDEPKQHSLYGRAMDLWR